MKALMLWDERGRPRRYTQTRAHRLSADVFEAADSVSHFGLREGGLEQRLDVG